MQYKKISAPDPYCTLKKSMTNFRINNECKEAFGNYLPSGSNTYERRFVF